MFVEIKVVPASGKQGFVIDKNGFLKCFLKSAPEKGAANKELIKQLSAALKITQLQVAIVSGLTSKKKRLKIEGLTEEQFWKSLGFDDQINQNKIF